MLPRPAGVRGGLAEIFGAPEQIAAVDPQTIGKIFHVGSMQGSTSGLGRTGIAVYRDIATAHHLTVGSAVPVVFRDTGPRTLRVALIYGDSMAAASSRRSCPAAAPRSSTSSARSSASSTGATRRRPLRKARGRGVRDLCRQMRDVRLQRGRPPRRNMALRAKEAIPVAAERGSPVRVEASPVRHGSRPGGRPEAPGWTTGRIVSVVIGVVLALCSLGLLGAGGVAVWANTTQRDAGYVDLGTASYTTSGCALASDTISVHGNWGWISPLIGQIRIRVTEAGRASGVFAGVATASAARNYLAGVAYTSYGGQSQRIGHLGSGVPRPPASAAIWAAQASGTRTATLLWIMRDGDWTVIVMNADRSSGVTVRAQAGASLPALRWLATQFLAGGIVLAVAAFVCLVVPARLAAASWAEDPGPRS